MRAHGRAAFAFVFVTVALDMLALGVIIPVLPHLVVELGGGDFGGAARVLGFFALVFAAAQCVFSPLLGALSDRFGRRPVILLSNVGLGLDSLLMALAPSLPWLLVGRVLSGITSASVQTANAYIADITPPGERAARYGLLGAAFGLGFIAGPAMGGLLGAWHLRLPFVVAAALSLTNAAYGYFILPESLPPDRRGAFAWGHARPLAALVFLRRHRALGGLALATFLFALAHESLPSVWVLYTGFRYGWTSSTVGLALALLGLGTTAAGALLAGPLVRRIGERGTTLIGLACGVAGFSIYACAGSGLVFAAGIPFIVLMSLAGPAIQSAMTRQVEAFEQGQLQGALSSARGIAGMLGPVLFTQVFSLASLRLPGAPFWLAATIQLAAIATLVAAWWIDRARPRPCADPAALEPPVPRATSRRTPPRTPRSPVTTPATGAPWPHARRARG